MGIHKTLEELQNTLANIIQNDINTSIVKSICGREYYNNNFQCVFKV